LCEADKGIPSLPMLICGASAEQDGKVLNKRETRGREIEKMGDTPEAFRIILLPESKSKSVALLSVLKGLSSWIISFFRYPPSSVLLGINRNVALLR